MISLAINSPPPNEIRGLFEPTLTARRRSFGRNGLTRYGRYLYSEIYFGEAFDRVLRSADSIPYRNAGFDETPTSLFGTQTKLNYAEH